MCFVSVMLDSNTLIILWHYITEHYLIFLCWYKFRQHFLKYFLVLGPDQNLVPIGVTKLYCDFQLDTYMRGLKMYDGLKGSNFSFKKGGSRNKKVSINYIFSSISPTKIHNTKFLT